MSSNARKRVALLAGLAVAAGSTHSATQAGVVAEKKNSKSKSKSKKTSKKFCLKNNMPYRELTMWEASVKLFGGLAATGREALAIRKEAKKAKMAAKAEEKAEEKPVEAKKVD